MSQFRSWLGDEFRTWLDVLSKVAIAVVGAAIAYIFAVQKQQNDDIKLITEFIVAEDEVRRELGKSIFSDYAEHGRLPESFIASILRFSSESPDKDLAQDVAASVEAAVAADQVSEDAIQAVEEDLPIRVYFHVQDKAQRTVAHLLQDELEGNATFENKGVTVPGIEMDESGPTRNELRCFSAEECGKAGRYLADFLRNKGVEMELVDLSRQHGDANDVPANYFEAWFASLPPDLAPNQTVTNTVVGQ
jgi:hypothetical protein